MKLELQPRMRRGKAGGLLSVEAQRPEGERFDPRFDLPKGETQRLLAMVAQGEQPSNPRECKKLDALVWLTWVDPKYSELLGQLPHFTTDVEANINVEEWEAKTNLKDALFEVDVLLQIHPELREHFASILKSGQIFTRYCPVHTSGTSQILRMIRLWPEKREELRNRYYPADQHQELLENIDHEIGHWARLTRAAELALLLPELRLVILQKVHKELTEWKPKIAEFQRSEIHFVGFEVLQQELSSLAILFAENAYIDEQGLVKLELPPLPAGKSVPLPERPQV